MQNAECDVHSAFCIRQSCRVFGRGRLVMRSGIVAAIACTAAAVAAGAAQLPQPSFVSTSSDLVVLPVTVADKRGQFVPDLGRNRFTVYDNGRRQEISLFSNEDTPVTVGLIIDNSGSMRPKLHEVVIATTAFARQSNPQD